MQANADAEDPTVLFVEAVESPKSRRPISASLGTGACPGPGGGVGYLLALGLYQGRRVAWLGRPAVAHEEFV